MAGSIVGEAIETSFDEGMKDFAWLIIRFIVVMVPLVFVINGLTKHNWPEAHPFSVAIAEGLTPEMFPMTVSVFVEGCARDVAQEGKRETAQHRPEPRRDGWV